MGERAGEVGGDGAGRPMSRGEFLGAGAMAAAGMAAGGAPLAGMGGPSTRERQAPAPPQELTWCIPAGVLNSLWCDFLPRLVAITWLKTQAPDLFQERYGENMPVLSKGMTAQGVAAMLRQYAQRLAPTDANPPDPRSLRDRLAKVRGFFELYENRATRNPFPLLIAGEGGFDFVLSNAGVELFIPSAPLDERELIRYYSFRQTGRPSLGVPDYLMEAMSLLSIDAPMGPSEVHLDEDFLPLGFESFRGRSLEELRERWQTTSWTLDVRQYLASLTSLRTWQIEGATYRGIANELPRVVALAWIEELDRRAAEDSCKQGPIIRPMPAEAASANVTHGPRSYWARFRRAGDDGLRQVFEERLETMLPKQARMEFCTSRHATGHKPPGWEDTDVMITNRGIYFPEPGAPPAMDKMLLQMATGHAGNPVFTDSRRPDGVG